MLSSVPHRADRPVPIALRTRHPCAPHPAQVIGERRGSFKFASQRALRRWVRCQRVLDARPVLIADVAA